MRTTTALVADGSSVASLPAPAIAPACKVLESEPQRLKLRLLELQRLEFARCDFAVAASVCVFGLHLACRFILPHSIVFFPIDAICDCDCHCCELSMAVLGVVLCLAVYLCRSSLPLSTHFFPIDPLYDCVRHCCYFQWSRFE